MPEPEVALALVAEAAEPELDATGVAGRSLGDVSDVTNVTASSKRIALKRARVSEIVFERLSSTTQRLMDRLETVPLDTAKDLQAASTALGILDDHFGGRQQATGSRFGEAEAFDGEVVETAERITRRYRSRGRS